MAYEINTAGSYSYKHVKCDAGGLDPIEVEWDLDGRW